MTAVNAQPPGQHVKKADDEDEPGSGYVHLVTGARFATSRASYPLKLLSPKTLPSQPADLATIYTLAYGGGLVAGDVMSLRVEVDEGCGLVMLTQGSTKVFKRRPGIRPRSHSLRIGSHPDADHWTAVQRLHVTLHPHSDLILLPDSVSPFKDSRYNQFQRFLLPASRTASAIILDWVNSGRGQQQGHQFAGHEVEVWSMARYASTNEIIIGDKTIMRERMVLDNLDRPKQDIARHLAPYNVYATVLIAGPKFITLIEHLRLAAEEVQQFQRHRPQELTWAFSIVDEGRAGVLRLAATEVEDVRLWLRGHLEKGGMKDLVGEGLWPRVM